MGCVGPEICTGRSSTPNVMRLQPTCGHLSILLPPPPELIIIINAMAQAYLLMYIHTYIHTLSSSTATKHNTATPNSRTVIQPEVTMYICTSTRTYLVTIIFYYYVYSDEYSETKSQYPTRASFPMYGTNTVTYMHPPNMTLATYHEQMTSGYICM